jgi:hypothetical protein
VTQTTEFVSLDSLQYIAAEVTACSSDRHSSHQNAVHGQTASSDAIKLQQEHIGVFGHSTLICCSQATSVAAALAATKCTIPAAAQHQAGDVNANPYQQSTSSKTCIGPHPGYAWVSNNIEATRTALRSCMQAYKPSTTQPPYGRAEMQLKIQLHTHRLPCKGSGSQRATGWCPRSCMHLSCQPCKWCVYAAGVHHTLTTTHPHLAQSIPHARAFNAHVLCRLTSTANR